jgi:hypothetical protein
MERVITSRASRSKGYNRVAHLCWRWEENPIGVMGSKCKFFFFFYFSVLEKINCCFFKKEICSCFLYKIKKNNNGIIEGIN